MRVQELAGSGDLCSRNPALLPDMHFLKGCSSSGIGVVDFGMSFEKRALRLALLSQPLDVHLVLDLELQLLNGLLCLLELLLHGLNDALRLLW